MKQVRKHIATKRENHKPKKSDMSQKEKIVRRDDAKKLANFIMFIQRSFLLDLSKELKQGNVSFPQFFLLGYLTKEDFLTMTEISKKMGHSTAAATTLVDKLEKLGYVQRLHASDDRRKVMVQITRKGIGLVESMREIMVDSLVDVMLERLSPSDPNGKIVDVDFLEKFGEGGKEGGGR